MGQPASVHRPPNPQGHQSIETWIEFFHGLIRKAKYEIGVETKKMTGGNGGDVYDRLVLAAENGQGAVDDALGRAAAMMTGDYGRHDAHPSGHAVGFVQGYAARDAHTALVRLTNELCRYNAELRRLQDYRTTHAGEISLDWGKAEQIWQGKVH